LQRFDGHMTLALILTNWKHDANDHMTTRFIYKSYGNLYRIGKRISFDLNYKSYIYIYIINSYYFH